MAPRLGVMRGIGVHQIGEVCALTNSMGTNLVERGGCQECRRLGCAEMIEGQTQGGGKGEYEDSVTFAQRKIP